MMANDDVIWENFPGNGLTYDEWHAIVIGTPGVLVGSAWAVNEPIEQAFAMLVTLLLVVVAIVKLPGRTKLGRIIGREGWYFWTTYLVTIIIGWIGHGVIA